MGQISLEGMEFYAYHGVYKEEQIIGNTFIVDVLIETELDAVAMGDDINNAINYETIYLICQAQMKETVQLIETLINNIVQAIKFQFSTIQSINVRIQKNRPIPGHRVSHSAVETTDNFVKECPRCHSPFICYQDDTCWCFKKQIPQGTRENLKTKYNGCLCEECLSFFAG